LTSTEEAPDGVVRLMTVHASKGLEFTSVFLTGLENGIFPLSFSTESEHNIEEERRLCYVGVTRAKRYLYITYADNRLIHGRRQYMKPSEFLKDMLIGEDSAVFKVGSIVEHRIYGIGTIINLIEDGGTLKLEIKFQGKGVKRVVSDFVKLVNQK
jgi:DNA helicase-2/ATP-dependent DNA helicase PcrA